MQIRKIVLFLFLLCFSFSVQAQQPSADQAAAQQMMMKKMEKVILSSLTQQDVDTFLKVVAASSKLKESDRKAWDAVEALDPVAKEKKISELAKLLDSEDYIVSIMRIQIAMQANDPAQLAQIKQQYEMAKTQVEAAKAQLAQVPEEQKKMMEKQMNLSLKMMEMMVNYPKAGLDIYTASKEKIDEGIKFLESK